MALPKRRKAMTESQVGENSQAALRLQYAQNTVVVSNTQATGVAPGVSPSAGNYQDLVLNTLTNPFAVSWISLGSNTFTLQPGTYEIEGSAPCQGENNNETAHKAKIRNITDSADALIGTAEYSNTQNFTPPITRSHIKGYITVTSPKSFKVQHRTQTAGSGSSFGRANNFGEVEVYVTLTIRKVA